MRARVVAMGLVGAGAALCASFAAAHHAIAAKFDDAKRMELRGIVTSVDWRNPHVHVFTNVTRDNGAIENWAVELESTVLLRRSGWRHDTLRPGDAIAVSGPAARDGSRQLWGASVVEAATNRQVYNVTDVGPLAPQAPRPTPRGASASRASTPSRSIATLAPACMSTVLDG